MPRKRMQQRSLFAGRARLGALVVAAAMAVSTEQVAGQSAGRTIVLLGQTAHGTVETAEALARESGRATGAPFSVRAVSPGLGSSDGAASCSAFEFETEEGPLSLLACSRGEDMTELLRNSSEPAGGAVLVVSAPDGPMPQSRRHLSEAQESGIPLLAIFLDRADVVMDPELLQLIGLELTGLAEDAGYRDVPIIVGSSNGALADDPAWRAPVEQLLAILTDSLPDADP